MTKIKRDDILALKSLAAKLRDELIEEYQAVSREQWKHKLFSDEFNALAPKLREAASRVDCAKCIVEDLLDAEVCLKSLEALE